MLDELENYRPESEPPAGVDAPAHRGQTMSIADLSASSISIEWYEAVAISQAMCETLRLSGDGAGRIHIGPEHVSIDGSGGVAVAAKPKRDGGSALDEVSGLLREMLGEQNIPTALRLALSQTAISNSLEEWSNTIAYYERPNRAELIQALYERSKNGPSRPATEAIAVASAPAPLASIPHPRKPKVPRPGVAQQSKRYAAVASVAVVLSALVGTAVWVIQTRQTDSPTISKVADLAVDSPPPALSRAASVVETLVNRIPLIGRRQDELQSEMPPPSSGRWIHLPSAGRSRVYQSSMLPVTRSLPLSIPSVAGEHAGNVSPLSFTARVSNTIYSAADNDVAPPVAVYPQFPSIPSGTDAQDVAEFDVIVTETGEVESVRARRVPATLSEALTMTMSLSAAKTWRFRPGLKNAEPVRYLIVVSILKNR